MPRRPAVCLRCGMKFNVEAPAWLTKPLGICYRCQAEGEPTTEEWARARSSSSPGKEPRVFNRRRSWWRPDGRAGDR